MLIHLLSFGIISGDFYAIKSCEIAREINAFGDSKEQYSSILICVLGFSLFLILNSPLQSLLDNCIYFMLQLLQVNNIVLSGNIYLQEESYPNTGDILSKDK